MAAPPSKYLLIVWELNYNLSKRMHYLEGGRDQGVPRLLMWELNKNTAKRMHPLTVARDQGVPHLLNIFPQCRNCIRTQQRECTHLHEAEIKACPTPQYLPIVWELNKNSAKRMHPLTGARDQGVPHLLNIFP
jgi:hypothetical protein